MSTSDQTTALTYALLASGAIPEQSVARIDPTAFPANGSGGYSVAGSLLAYVHVSTRVDAFHRRCVVTFTSVDLTGTYTTDLGGVTYTYDAAAGAPADLAELLDQWAAELNADAPTAAIVTASATATALTLIWVGDTTGIAITETGTSVLTYTTEYESGTAYLAERADVRVTTGNALDAALWGGWQTYTAIGFDGTLTLANGQGARMMLGCAGRAALAVYVPSPSLAGHADDGPSAGGATLAYTGPWALIAPVVAH